MLDAFASHILIDMKQFFTLALTALTFGAFAQNDPQSCYEPNSAVYDCTMTGYDDGYEDGLANCEVDTVYVTISNDEYYLNTILLLDSALTILQQENTELTLQLNECLVADTICGTDDGALAELEAELALVEDEVIYWMEAYNDAVTECNDYVEDLLDNYAACEAFADSLQTQLNDCADAVQWNADLLNDCRERLADCDGYDIYTGLPVLEATYDVYGAPVDVRNYTGVVIYVFSNGTSVRGMNVAQ